MASTSYRFADYAARPDRAVGHIHVDGRYEPLYVRDADPEAPAGGVSSSVNDMTRWLTMVLANGSHEGKQIVDSKGAAACGDAADRVEPRDGARDAVGVLRLRIQRGCDVGGAHGAQPLRRRSNSARAPTSSSCRRPTWRSSRSPTPRRPVCPNR